MTVLGVALACLASCLFNAGIAIQASEARDVPREHGLRVSLIGKLLKRPRWLPAAHPPPARRGAARGAPPPRPPPPRPAVAAPFRPAHRGAARRRHRAAAAVLP